MLNRLFSRDVFRKVVNLAYFGASFFVFAMWGGLAWKASSLVIFVFGGLAALYLSLFGAAILDVFGKLPQSTNEKEILGGRAGVVIRAVGLLLPAPFLAAFAAYVYFIPTDLETAYAISARQYAFFFGEQKADEHMRFEEACHLEEATILEKRGDLKGAFGCYRRAVLVHPCFITYAALGACADKLGKTELADASYDLGEMHGASQKPLTESWDKRDGKPKLLCDGRFIRILQKIPAKGRHILHPSVLELEQKPNSMMWATYEWVTPAQYERVKKMREAPPAVRKDAWSDTRPIIYDKRPKSEQERKLSTGGHTGFVVTEEFLQKVIDQAPPESLKDVKWLTPVMYENLRHTATDIEDASEVRIFIVSEEDYQRFRVACGGNLPSQTRPLGFPLNKSLNVAK